MNAEFYDQPATVPVPHIGVIAGTGSMGKMFTKGQLVIILPHNFDNLKIGDIVIIKHPHKWVIHEIVSKRDTKHGVGYVTKGRANKERDRVILTRDNFIGLVKL
jgi:signal peptidase I